MSPDDRDGWVRLIKTDKPGFVAARKAIGLETRINLRGADLAGVSLDGVGIAWSDLTGANLSNAEVEPISLASCKLKDTNLSNVHFLRDKDGHFGRHVKLIRMLWGDIDG